MRDLSSHRLLGSLAATAILWDSRSLRTAAFLAIAIWAFARAYYFAFYVIHHYIAPSYHFSGLFSAFRFLLTRRRP